MHEPIKIISAAGDESIIEYDREVGKMVMRSTTQKNFESNNKSKSNLQPQKHSMTAKNLQIKKYNKVENQKPYLKKVAVS